MKNLVIVRAGAESLHRDWMSGTEPRNFDIIVAAYHPAAMRDNEAFVEVMDIPGFKVRGWSDLFQARPDLLAKYERIAFIDDDIQTSLETINRCFEIGEERDLVLWQPSLTWDSYATFGATLHNPAFELRYVNVIELMVPFFRSDHLRRCLPLIGLGYEIGVDLVWCSLRRRETDKFAVIDSLTIKHTRPVGKQNHENGFVDKTYEEDIMKLLAEFDAPWPSWVASTGVTSSGRTVSGKLELTVRAFVLLGSLFSAPRGNFLYRLKCVTDHIRHQFTRPPLFIEDANDTLADLVMRHKMGPGH